MEIRNLPDQIRYASLSTAELRRGFLIESLFLPGGFSFVYADVDRAVVGSAVPTTETLALPTYDALRADRFLKRRELGVLNIGGPGTVVVDSGEYRMDKYDSLYVGQGACDVLFSSDDPLDPAKFYLLSYPAHARMLTEPAKRAHAEAVELGAAETCNRRTLYKYIHPTGIQSCQLVMGFTQLAEGSAWNTMPPHTHLRRSEIYLYFDLAPDARVFHLMGTPQETRHLVVANEQVVISPPWSIHSGVGTSRYTFCWGMGGENQEFADMDAVAIGDLL